MHTYASASSWNGWKFCLAFAVTFERKKKNPDVIWGRANNPLAVTFCSLLQRENWASFDSHNKQLGSANRCHRVPGHRFLCCCPSSQFLSPVICPHFSAWLRLSFSLCPAFSHSHLLPLTFCAPRSLFSSLLYYSLPLLLSLATLSLSLVRFTLFN